jgi:hypothetical protein
MKISFALVLWMAVAGCKGSNKNEQGPAPSAAPVAAPAAGGDDVRAKWGAAHARVEALQNELQQTEVAITLYHNVLDGKGGLTNEKTVAEAKVKLPELEKEQTDLSAKLASAQAEEAKYKPGADAARTKGLGISKECLDNPLAKGCS